jgi:hypothetical protein
MEVLGSAPACALARIGAPAWPVPVRSSGPPGSATDRRSGPLSALAEEPFERVVRQAAMVLDTPLASVTVPGKRCPSRRTCLASTRAEADRETRPSVIMAASNQSPLDWPAADPRGLTSVHVVTLELKGSRHETGGQPGCGGAWLAAQSWQPIRTTPTAAAAGTARMPLPTTMRCPQPAMVRVSGRNGPFCGRAGRSGRR